MTIRTKLVGVTKTNPDGQSRQDLIHKYVGEDELLLLVRDHDNQYDPNAIGVFANPLYDHDGPYLLGYINADLAAQIAPIIDQGSMVACTVLNITGGDGKTLGVNVELDVISKEDVEKHQATNMPVKLPVVQQAKTKKKKNRLIALLLCIFTGFFGGHMFYVGRIVTGILYFFTVGLFMVGWIVDLIKIATGNFRDCDNRII